MWGFEEPGEILIPSAQGREHLRRRSGQPGPTGLEGGGEAGGTWNWAWCAGSLCYLAYVEKRSAIRVQGERRERV